MNPNNSERNSFLTFSNFISSSVIVFFDREYRRFEKNHVTIDDTIMEPIATATVIITSDSIIIIPLYPTSATEPPMFLERVFVPSVS